MNNLSNEKLEYPVEYKDRYIHKVGDKYCIGCFDHEINVDIMECPPNMPLHIYKAILKEFGAIPIKKIYWDYSKQDLAVGTMSLFDSLEDCVVAINYLQQTT